MQIRLRNVANWDQNNLLASARTTRGRRDLSSSSSAWLPQLVRPPQFLWPPQFVRLASSQVSSRLPLFAHLAARLSHELLPRLALTLTANVACSFAGVIINLRSCERSHSQAGTQPLPVRKRRPRRCRQPPTQEDRPARPAH